MQRYYYALALPVALKVSADQRQEPGAPSAISGIKSACGSQCSQDSQPRRRALELAKRLGSSVRQRGCKKVQVESASASCKAHARPVLRLWCRGYPDIVPGVDQCIQRPGHIDGTSFLTSGLRPPGLLANKQDEVSKIKSRPREVYVSCTVLAALDPEALMVFRRAVSVGTSCLNRYDVGLDKIMSTEEQVTTMQATGSICTSGSLCSPLARPEIDWFSTRVDADTHRLSWRS